MANTFPIPSTYRPYVNFAKKVYEQAYGLDVPYGKLAVAENERYIAVHFLEDDFRLVSYDADTTEYTATGISFVAYDKKNDVYDSTPTDNRTTTSEGGRFINNWVWSEVDVTWNGSTVFTTTEGWYYNGVKFPCIDDVWTDKETYPYVELAVFADPTDKSIAAYTVNCYSEPAYIESHDDSAIVGQYFPKATNILSYSITWHEGLASELGFNVGEWSDGTASSEEADTYAGVYLFTSLWSNYDIIDVFTDSMYLAGSEPVHVTYTVDEGGEGGGEGEDITPAYDELSFKIGLALGLCGKGIPEDLQVVSGSKVVTWDGNKEGLIQAECTVSNYPIYYKISNMTQNLVGATIELTMDGSVAESAVVTEDLVLSSSGGVIAYNIGPWFVAQTAGSSYGLVTGVITFPETGLYVSMDDSIGDFLLVITLP